MTPVADPRQPFIGTSPLMRRLRVEAEKALLVDAPVLILGEAGSGKGTLARWLHKMGRRSGRPMAGLNCLGHQAAFLEAELFGAPGSATRAGLVQAAEGGTLFLEGIGDMDPGLQERLLTVLETKRFRPAGEDEDQPVDVRLIAATHQHPDVDLRWGRLRRDLYLRHHTLVLNVPPLRKRAEDIPPLAEAFLDAIGREAGKPGLAFTEDALYEMGNHRWHGNLRELRNAIEHAVLQCPGSRVRAADLQLGASSSEATPNYGTRIELAEIERLHIRRVLEEEGGRIEDAARRLDMPQQLLLNRLRKSEDRGDR